MNTNISIFIASILGPILIAISSSEYANFKIWKKVDPSIVYLNGLILFAVGLLIVRFHNIWTPQWQLAITISGWLLLASGLYRMFFPTRQQAPGGRATNLLILTLFITGCFLTWKGYV